MLYIGIIVSNLCIVRYILCWRAYMNKKVLNIKTGKLENCTVGHGCRKHSHDQIKINTENIINIAREINSAKSKTTMTVTDLSGNQEELDIIVSTLGGEPHGLQKGEGVYVEIPKEEARFMDMDKLTHALGYAIFKDTFNHNITITYNTYGNSDNGIIYLVNRI